MEEGRGKCKLGQREIPLFPLRTLLSKKGVEMAKNGGNGFGWEGVEGDD